MPESIVIRSGTVASRLEMCRDIMKLQSGIEHAPEAFKVKASVLGRRRIEALRSVLLNRPGRTMADDILSPAVGYRVLIDILDGLDGKPRAERLRVATYVNEIHSMMNAIIGAELSGGLGGAISNAVDAGYGTSQIRERARAIIDEFGDTEAVDESIDEHLKAGDMSGIKPALSAAIEATAGAKSAVSIRLEDVAPDLAERKRLALEAMKPIEEELNALADKHRAMMKEAIRAPVDEQDSYIEPLKVLKRDYDDAYRLYSERWSTDIQGLEPLIKEAFDKAKREAEKPVLDIGQAVIDDMMATSKISPEEADSWAAGVEITKAATGRLKKMGYPIDQVRKDMAEFYRFSGGRVTKVKIDSKGDKRANASDIATHGTTGSVFLDSSFTKRTLWHELAHHLESDPVARRASGRLVRRRSVDGNVHSLRSLTGSRGYKSHEVAYKNGFFHPYVGKIYRDGMTEVFSMGVESFSDPLVLGRRMAEDPQTLEFVAGYLKAEIDPLSKAFMAMRDIMEELQSESREKEAESAVDLIAKLSERVTLTKDEDASWLGRWDWFVSSTKGKQIGTVDGWYVFQERVMSWETRRKSLGYVFRRLEKDGSGSESLSRHEIAVKDLNTALAAFFVFQKTGRFPSISDMNNVAFLLSHIIQ